MPLRVQGIVAIPSSAQHYFREVAPPTIWLLPDICAIVDTGLPNPEILAELLTHVARWPSLHILMTHDHPDHVGNLVELVAARPDAVVYGPASISHVGQTIHARLQLVSPDSHLEELGIDVLGTPGHTDDHLSYYAHHDLLAAGDLILGEGTPWVGPPEGDLGDYLHSLQRIAALPDSVRLLGGHGPERHSAPDLARTTHRHRMMRESMVLDVWSTGMREPRDIATEIYQNREQMRLDPMRFEMAVWTVAGHIEYAQRRGLI